MFILEAIYLYNFKYYVLNPLQGDWGLSFFGGLEAILFWDWGLLLFLQFRLVQRRPKTYWRKNA